VGKRSRIIRILLAAGTIGVVVTNCVATDKRRLQPNGLWVIHVAVA
jgi:hypothetical protein